MVGLIEEAKSLGELVTFLEIFSKMMMSEVRGRPRTAYMKVVAE